MVAFHQRGLEPRPEPTESTERGQPSQAGSAQRPMGRARKHAGPCCELDGFKLVSLGLARCPNGRAHVAGRTAKQLPAKGPPREDSLRRTETKGGVRIDVTPANAVQGGIRRKDQFHRPHLPSHRDNALFQCSTSVPRRERSSSRPTHQDQRDQKLVRATRIKRK